MFLLDTNVVSEFRRARPHGGVAAWLRSVQPSEVYLPSVVAGEITAGILNLRKQNEQRAAVLQTWFDAIDREANYIPAGPSVFKRWAYLMQGVDARHFIDALIAATALEHHLIVVTRYTRDFKPFQVPTLNPFNFQ